MFAVKPDRANRYLLEEKSVIKFFIEITSQRDSEFVLDIERSRR